MPIWAQTSARHRIHCNYLGDLSTSVSAIPPFIQYVKKQWPFTWTLCLQQSSYHFPLWFKHLLVSVLRTIGSSCTLVRLHPFSLIFAFSIYLSMTGKSLGSWPFQDLTSTVSCPNWLCLWEWWKWKGSTHLVKPQSLDMNSQKLGATATFATIEVLWFYLSCVRQLAHRFLYCAN